MIYLLFVLFAISALRVVPDEIYIVFELYYHSLAFFTARIDIRRKLNAQAEGTLLDSAT